MLTLQEKIDRRKRLREQRHQRQRLDMLDALFVEKPPAVAPADTQSPGSHLSGNSRANDVGIAGSSLGGSASVMSGQPIECEPLVMPPRQVMDTSAVQPKQPVNPADPPMTLAQMLRASIADLWSCNPNASLTNWPARSAAMSSLQPPGGRKAAGSASIPELAPLMRDAALSGKLSSTLSKTRGGVNSTGSLLMSGSLHQPQQQSQGDWPYPFPRPQSRDRFASTTNALAETQLQGRMVPHTAVDVLVTALEATTKGDFLPAFRWEPEICDMRSVAGSALPAVESSTASLVQDVFGGSSVMTSLLSGQLQGSSTVGGSISSSKRPKRGSKPGASMEREFVSNTTVLRMQPGTDRHAVSFKTLDFHHNDPPARKQKFGAEVYKGEEVLFGEKGLNPFKPFGLGVSMIGDAINPLEGFHVRKGRGTGAGAKTHRVMIDKRYGGVSRNLASVSAIMGIEHNDDDLKLMGDEHEGDHDDDGSDGSVRGPLFHTKQLNTMLSDTRRLWNRRRQSIDEMHAREREMKKKRQREYRPWRQEADVNAAIKLAADFLKVAVEPVEGTEGAAFRVRPPLRAMNPHPRIEDIMDATAFLAAKRQEQLTHMEAFTTGYTMCKFQHIDGSHVCSELYAHHTLPDGTIVHLYYADKMNELVSVRAVGWLSVDVMVLVIITLSQQCLFTAGVIMNC